MSNVWLPRWTPLQSSLSGVVKRSREAYMERSPVYKRARIEEIAGDPPQAMVRFTRRGRPGGRRSVKRRRTPFRRFRRRTRARISTLAPKTKLIRCKVTGLRTNGGHAAGSLEMVPVQMNSILDPFGGAGSEQPLGFDQWRALYEFGYVVGAKITCEFHNADAFAYVVGITPCHIAQGTTSLASYEYYKELPGTKSVILSPDIDKAVLQSKISIKKWFSVKDLVDTNEYRINLNTPSEPSKLAYWHLWSQPLDQSSTDTTGVQIVMNVEYIVLLTSPVIPARSSA